MNEEQKDKGLKRAIKRENGFHLPSNFSYHTMRKVEEAIRLREKKSERMTLFGDTVKEAFTPTTDLNLDNIRIPAFYVLIFIATPLFVLFDHWMRKRYYRHHS